jgi:hypothetical protein
VVQGFDIAHPVAAAAIESATAAGSIEAARVALPATTAPVPPAPATGAPRPGPGPGTGPSPAPAVPVVQVSLRSGTTAGAAVGVGGGACTGLDLAGTVVGCAPPPSGGLLTVKTGGSLLGNTTIAI